MIFAIIETGAKQYKVKEGDILEIEKLSGDFKEGDKIIFDEVVLLDDNTETKLGEPFLENTKVEGKFLEEIKGKKVVSLRFKNKTNQNFGVKKGHRQRYFKVQITKI